MKSKKLTALALAAALMTGAAGSYAYFSSTASIETPANLIIETGSMNLKADSGVWVTNDNNETSKVDVTDANGNTTTKFTNVRPGESFVKDYYIKPTDSTLKQKVAFTGGNIKNQPEGISLSFYAEFIQRDADGNVIDYYPVYAGNEITFNPEFNEEIRVSIKATANTSMNNTDSTNASNQLRSFDLNDCIEKLVFTGKQMNQ
ncbi:SipW-cognate class signal peptide [Clostridium collagenovorans DSM 3089]|uniref:SipW-cognate class signal peptide n=1 Tax=Clostridium collagenovorans DSM 3089 TaxID=1121306 RepID=A0A1M5Y9V1_9CLOT|nr:SipW-dependent-type signal peptide-containing protein [Clostridium collagenovorans]SHI08860.1 SipW-cognate class signal peptide [Clostridium collagenovorans DSM 3089]